MLGFRKNCCKILMSKRDLGETMSKLSEVCEQYLGNAKRDDKGEMTAPCRPGQSVTQNKQQGQWKAVCAC